MLRLWNNINNNNWLNFIFQNYQTKKLLKKNTHVYKYIFYKLGFFLLIHKNEFQIFTIKYNKTIISFYSMYKHDFINNNSKVYWINNLINQLPI